MFFLCSPTLRYARDARSVSPDRIEYVPEDRPTAPQRKKALERKLTNGSGMLLAKRAPPEPQVIEYAPRSRSISPIQIPPAATTLRKPYQKTRFSSIQDLSHHQHQQQQQQQHASRGSGVNTRAQSTPPKSKVGSAIGNSIRKLVGKIRSASAERKLRLKSSIKHRSPSPSSSAQKRNSSSSATYQQYNVIDSHIGGRGYSPPPAAAPQGAQNQSQSQHQRVATAPNGVSHKSNGNISRRDRDRDRSDPVVNATSNNLGFAVGTGGRRGSSDIVSDMTTNSGGVPTPKQKYYLGENPYGGSIFGKENKYADGSRQQVRGSGGVVGEGRGQPQRSEERIVTSSHTR